MHAMSNYNALLANIFVAFYLLVNPWMLPTRLFPNDAINSRTMGGHK